ncbi:MAG TPA: hypothetical protein VN867_03665 [Candidatus Binataceae bacterium]|nr:hypothetical protein [Candidatus Binataceae bacterium]
MSSKQTLGAREEARETANDARARDEHENRDEADNSLAKKLSNELDNWRRQRNGTKPKRLDNGNGSNTQSSGPARTIRVRGHETLVVRRPKLPPKPEGEFAPEKD